MISCILCTDLSFSTFVRHFPNIVF